METDDPYGLREKMRCTCTCQMCQDLGPHERSWLLNICHGTAEMDWKERPKPSA